MKPTLLVLLFLASATAVVGQAGHAGQENNLSGLTGVRLVVMFGGGDGLPKVEQTAILKLVEPEAIAKFEKARIPLFRYAQETQAAGSPQLIVYITSSKSTSFAPPLEIRAKLLQRVRLARDPSIEADLATWEHWGVGGPESNVELIRKVAAAVIDQFIQDYIKVNRG
jgi:hypothetical protein